nr:WAT1-related protein At3g28050-like isoform X1 [Ziziphus jujuba var. spinosa]
MGKVALLPFVGMMMTECAQAGLIIISKVVMSKGMNNLIFIFYSNLLASPILLLFSFLFHRSERPQLTPSIHAGFFLLGVLGFFAQFFGYTGINYSSPTLGTAMLNLVPAFTFIFAITLRMEIFNWRSSSTLAKSVGTIVSITGAFIVTLYKGPSLLMTSPSFDLSHAQLLAQQPNWIVGGLFLVVDCIMSSSWTIVEAKILRKYPAGLIVVFFYCFYAAVLSGAVSLIVERDPSAWSLKPNIRLLAVLYSAVFGSAFQVGVSTWCLSRTDPVFVAMFKPVGIVVTVIVGVIFMGETLYFGRLIGAIIIVAGFYSVMWGKAKEAKIDEDVGISSLESNRQQAPLLQNSIES